MKRSHIILIIALIFLPGSLYLYLNLTRPKEPAYEGKTLTQWLEQYDVVATRTAMRTPEEDARQKEAQRAVRQIGTNAIPFLLKWLKADDLPYYRRIWVMTREHVFHNLRPTRAMREYHLALNGFDILGKRAESATPLFLEMTSSRHSSDRLTGLQCLASIRPEKNVFLPVLQRTLWDPEPSIGITAAEYIMQYFPEEFESSGVKKRFSYLTKPAPKPPRLTNSRSVK